MHNLKDKIILVTGATAGIGQITAAALAAAGAQVTISGRNEAKTRAAAEQIKAQTGNENVDYLLGDFSDLEQVRRLAAAFQKRQTRLDVLVNNAGAFFNARHATSFGVEKTFLVNHLAPFLLTLELLEPLKASPAARIVNVSSEAHRSDQMNFNDLGFRRFYFGMLAYARSKLANILFTYELARRLAGSPVTVNALHPGHVATDIWKTNFSIFGPLLKGVMSRVALTPEQGADNSIFLASAPEVASLTGQYFIKRVPAVSSPVSYDLSVARKLWDFSARTVGLEAERSIPLN